MIRLGVCAHTDTNIMHISLLLACLILTCLLNRASSLFCMFGIHALLGHSQGWDIDNFIIVKIENYQNSNYIVSHRAHGKGRIPDDDYVLC